jgi:hypothetical protein
LLSNATMENVTGRSPPGAGMWSGYCCRKGQLST